MDDFKDKTVSLFENAFNDLIHSPLFCLEKNKLGLSKYILHNAERIITIPSFGTVRSLNVGSAAAIIMAMYRNVA